jgi:hypothetical protein
MLSTTRNLGVGRLSFLLVPLDALVELVVDVAGIRVVRVWADSEVLLLLPLEDALAPRRVVAPLLDLLDQHTCLLLVEISILRKPLNKLLFTQEVAGHHREGEPTVVADVLSPIERFIASCRTAIRRTASAKAPARIGQPILAAGNRRAGRAAFRQG